MKKELMMAVLAMDAYNRGYDPGLVIDNNLQTRGVGSATFDRESDVNIGTLGRSESFYAVSYTWNGEKIISFRGTDNNAIDPNTGYGISLDIPTGPQAFLAAEFYRSVVGDGNRYSANVALTGRSLGGGLACPFRISLKLFVVVIAGKLQLH
jgi:hypothetical protein